MNLSANPKWTPSSPAVVAGDFEACTVLVVHYWATWDHADREMDQRLASLRAEYGDRICFRSCDVDRAENQPFIHKIGNVPALGCFAEGKWLTSLIGLRSEEELRQMLDNWLALANKQQR